MDDSNVSGKFSTLKWYILYYQLLFNVEEYNGLNFLRYVCGRYHINSYKVTSKQKHTTQVFIPGQWSIYVYNLVPVPGCLKLPGAFFFQNIPENK